MVDAITAAPLVLVAAYYVGRVFAAARLPKISGYLFTGVICGPQGLGLLSTLARRRARGDALGSERMFHAECASGKFQKSVWSLHEQN